MHRVLREREREKNHQEISNLLKEDQEAFGCLDFSFSDDDMAHRNSIIQKKAIATWEISSILGVVFYKDKNQMIEIFQRLEEEDRRIAAV
ncbi:hypothetical protein DITRI_Ditri11bG0055400 [Diplodiscus trichospermus]